MRLRAKVTRNGTMLAALLLAALMNVAISGRAQEITEYKTKLNFGVAIGLHIELPEIEVCLRAVNRETECGHGVIHVYFALDVFKFKLENNLADHPEGSCNDPGLNRSNESRNFSGSGGHGNALLCKERMNQAHKPLFAIREIIANWAGVIRMPAVKVKFDILAPVGSGWLFIRLDIPDGRRVVGYPFDQRVFPAGVRIFSRDCGYAQAPGKQVVLIVPTLGEFVVAGRSVRDL